MGGHRKAGRAPGAGRKAREAVWASVGHVWSRGRTPAACPCPGCGTIASTSACAFPLLVIPLSSEPSTLCFFSWAWPFW